MQTWALSLHNGSEGPFIPAFVHSTSLSTYFARGLWLSCFPQPIGVRRPGSHLPLLKSPWEPEQPPVSCPKTGAPEHSRFPFGATRSFQTPDGWPGRLLGPASLPSCSQGLSCPPGCCHLRTSQANSPSQLAGTGLRRGPGGPAAPTLGPGRPGLAFAPPPELSSQGRPFLSLLPWGCASSLSPQPGIPGFLTPLGPGRGPQCSPLECESQTRACYCEMKAFHHLPVRVFAS